jgi:predicted nucleic acid-binding protein
MDTSVYIDLWTGALAAERLSSVRRGLVVRHSSVVLSELGRGARTRAAVKVVESLKRVSRSPWTPTAEDWWKAGALVRDVGDEQGWEVGKRREFQNDALIALTARRRGAVIVTRNRFDFALLERAVGVQVLVV